MAGEAVLSHQFVSQIADDPNTALVRPSNWNHKHILSGGATDEYLRWDSSQESNASWDNIFARLPFIDITKAPYLAIGDGVTDDASAIAAAITDLSATGGTIVFPGQKVYGIGNSGITIANVTGIRLVGNGGAQLKALGTSSATITTFGATMIVLKNAIRCGIEDLTIDPVGDNLNHQTIGLESCSECVISRNVLLHSGKLAGVCSLSGQYNKYLNNYIITGAVATTTRGMWLGTTAAREATAEIRGNILSGQNGHGISGCWLNCLCTGNTIIQCAGSGIVVESDATGSSGYCTISENTCTTNVEWGIYLFGTSSGRTQVCRVVNNYCANNNSGGIRAEGVFETIIESNHCDTNGVNGGTAFGISIVTAQRTTVVANQCTELRNGASRGQQIGIDYSITGGQVDTNCQISDNQCANHSSDGIRLVSTAGSSLKGLIVKGNISSGNGTLSSGTGLSIAPHAATAIDYVVVKDNIFYGNLGTDMAIGPRNVLTNKYSVKDNVFDTPTSDATYLLNSGLSATAIQAKNLRGSVTIADGNSQATVTFTTAETDTSYYVAFGVEIGGGSPTITTPVLSNKATTGFNIALPSAPGAGTSLIISWHLFR